MAASRRRRLLGTGTSTFGVARRIVDVTSARYILAIHSAMAAELRGWTNFFTQLSSFLVSCERHYGLANKQYTEYAIERLSQQCQSVQAILDPIRRAASADLSSLSTSLTQLLEHLHAILNQWEQYSDTLDIQQVRRYCPPLVPLSSGHGRPRFDISQEQLQYLRSLSSPGLTLLIC